MFKKATKTSAHLRAAMFGPSGSGKTFSALRIAKGIGGRVALIDTERGSASKYADRFDFDVLDLADKSIDGYVAAIREAAQAGYEVLVIDSLSHAWADLLTEVEKLARAKYKGNTWSAWSEGTPRQHRLVDAILDFPGHLIATMRSRTEWVEEKTDNGRMRPVRVGLAPMQGKSIEYEFDVLIELSTEHIATIIKDRSGRFQDRLIEKPDESFGAEMGAWLKDGVPPSDESTKAHLIEALKAERKDALERGASKESLDEAMSAVRGKKPESLTVEALRFTIAAVQALTVADVEDRRNHAGKTRAEALVEDVVGDKEDVI